MSWSFRALVLWVALLWAVLPQLACFMPDQALTQPEKDCCEKMANDCGGTNMSHACCRTLVRSDAAISAKAIGNLMPRDGVAAKPISIAASLPIIVPGGLSSRNDHAPPHDAGVSALILRI